MMQQGQIWLMEQPDQEGRPAILVSRDWAISNLNKLVVAPVTRTLHTAPSCLPVGPAEGLNQDSVATFDNLTSVSRSVLTQQLGELDEEGRRRMCDALRAMAKC